jgi:alpha-beta hydrolase superfamily lysophospholipase
MLLPSRERGARVGDLGTRHGETDILGGGYTAFTLPMGHDDEGEVVATLVRRRAPEPTTRAVLYLHGYTDYFFQRHLADFYIDHGYHFYALDLRKYGRSLRDHQTPNFCRSLAEYLPELTEATRIIREEDGVRTLLVNGHSTGGLLASLWARRVRVLGWVQGLVLNAPFFDQNVPAGTRPLLDPVVNALARRRPRARLPVTVHETYGQSIHVNQRGEWEFDLRLKPHGGFPVRAAWLAAVLRGQRVLRRGLDLEVPVQVLSSDRSRAPGPFDEEARRTDIVLNVEHIARYAPRLGADVTYTPVEGGLHDLTLSAPEVREQVFKEMARWMDTRLPVGHDV